MLMPTKIIQPVDSLFSISAFVLKVLSDNKLNIDEIHVKVNKIYHKEVSLEKIMLSLNFLYMISKVRIDNETITINI
ncbi:MAG: Unknown protein [uncultured Sulfurovum sp.]|uniref:Uncharacterized protein n=1 Tax=uncultured Sulfurovum sp. TaxID=269237 RepID=A0A6S6SZI9_9BACT|nr:MAG: Unknown protein [uncultured Sulfurovum sp.]